MGSNRFHCSFVSSIPILLHNQDSMSRIFFEIGSRKVLETHGHRVSIVPDGEKALDTMEESAFDLLITDYRMPVVDGIELIRAVRSREHLQNMPVIMLTAKNELDTEVEAIGAGADDYLTKPIQVRRLLARVGRFFRRRRQILVVEDSPDTARLLERILQGAGFAVACAANGVEALDAVAASPPDLILTDLKMPKMDGLVLIQKLKSSPYTSDIPVIMLTAKDEVDSEIDAIDGGADDYIVKPVVAKKLIARVQKVFRLQKH
jgi:DNA-binding response OmpR family regulator